MSVVAFLVMGSDGSSTLDGSSSLLSTQSDRTTFLNSRRSFACILVGGRTAESEPYDRTPAPLIIISRSLPQVLGRNPQAHWWNMSPGAAVAKAKREFGTAIAIEGGINFLATLLGEGLVDELRLSVTPMAGGENKVNSADLFACFQHVEESQRGDTNLFICTSPKAKSRK